MILLYDTVDLVHTHMSQDNSCASFCDLATALSQSVEMDGKELFDRKTEGRFPEPKEIKQMIRDRIAPNKNLGHSDVGDGKSRKDESNDGDDDDMDDDAAEEARKFFGVM